MNGLERDFRVRRRRWECPACGSAPGRRRPRALRNGVKRDRRQLQAKLIAQGQPDRMHGARRVARALVWASRAAIERDRPVDGFDHLKQRDRGGRTSQADAALRAAMGDDNALGGEAREDLRQKGGGDVLAGGDVLGKRTLALRQQRQVQHGSNGVVGLSRNFHDALLINRTIWVNNTIRPLLRAT